MILDGEKARRRAAMKGAISNGHMPGHPNGREAKGSLFGIRCRLRIFNTGACAAGFRICLSSNCVSPGSLCTRLASFFVVLHPAINRSTSSGAIDSFFRDSIRALPWRLRLQFRDFHSTSFSISSEAVPAYHRLRHTENFKGVKLGEIEHFVFP